MKLDVLIRVAGSVRSPIEQIEALLRELGPDVTVLVTEPYDAGEYLQLGASDSLDEVLGGDSNDRILIYGDEHLLPQLRELSVETYWMAVGPGANPLRNVWRVRGANPWLGSARLNLLLEDEAVGKSLAGSPTLNTGRISRLVVMAPPVAVPAEIALAAEALEAEPLESEPPESEPESSLPVLAAVAAAVLEEPVVEITAEEEAVLMGETETLEGATEIMATLEGARDTQQALLTRYALVKERRTLVPRITETEAQLEELLRELFVTRFQVSIETAGAFEETTARLARIAAEYRELLVRRARVEEDLEALAWLKNELEM